MQSIFELFSSNVMILAHVAVTLCLLGFVLVTVMPMMSRHNAIINEISRLRDDLRDSDDRHRRAEQRLIDEQRRHRQLLSKIGDDIYEVCPLQPEDFDTVRDIDTNLKALRDEEPDLESVPQVMLSEQPSMMTAEHEFQPFRESVTDISVLHGELDGPLDDSINDESDPLTRALKISKAIRR